MSLNFLSRSIAVRVTSAALAFVMAASSAAALPSNFVGKYEILDSRQLSISGGATYVIQDGKLVVETMRDVRRPYCRSLQTTFDEASGKLDVKFEELADGKERAILETIPGAIGARVTTIECYTEGSFFGALDLSVALGRIVSVSR